MLGLVQRAESNWFAEDLRRATAAMRSAEALLVAAGAGMGVDSGLPDFRGQAGFWRAYPALKRLGVSFEEMAQPGWFRDDPSLAWGFYGHRLNLYRRTDPHEGFARLLDLGKSKPEGYFVFTSNVDGQFQKAGFAEERIVECHGSIHHLQCVAPCSEAIWDAATTTVAVDEDACRAQEPLPHCSRCGGLARPNILMFGDWGWVGNRADGQRSRFETWLKQLAQNSTRLVIVELGAGEAIPTVRYTCERIAQRFQATLIRINPRDASVPAGHVGLVMGAAEGVQRIAGEGT